MERFDNFKKVYFLPVLAWLIFSDYLAVHIGRPIHSHVTEVHEVRKFNKNKLVDDPDQTPQNKRFFGFTP